jgi:hypothetical protein
MQRVEDIIRYLSGQIEVDVPLIGLSGRSYKITRVTTASYSATKGDHFILVNVASDAVITLTGAPNNGQVQIVQDSSGSAATNNITIQPNSGTINGADEVVIKSAYGRVDLVYSADDSIWLAQSSTDHVFAGFDSGFDSGFE